MQYEVGMIVEHKQAPYLGQGKIVEIRGSTLAIKFENEERKEYHSEKTPLRIILDKKNKVINENNDVKGGVDVDCFARPEHIHSLENLKKSPPSRNSGVYAWYFCKLPPYVPKTRCNVIKRGWWPFRKKLYLLYIGKASNLNERVLSEHYLGNYVRGQSISSLRLSLGCLLCRELGIYLQKHPASQKDYTFGKKGDKKLSNWMAKYARVTWVEIEKKEDREIFEMKAIQGHVLPLNTDDNTKPFQSLVMLRDHFRKIARSENPQKSDYKKEYKKVMKGLKE